MRIAASTYALVAESLRARILAGQWQPGDRLPTEFELCRQFHTSRITVRRALQILHQELLICRRQGSGTFVGVMPTRKIPILSADFFGSVTRHAPKLKRTLRFRQWNSASEQVAAQLGLAVGERVLAAQRADFLEGKPVALDEAFLVGRFAENLSDEDLVELDFLRRWEQVQRIELDYCTQAVEALPAREALARILGTTPGKPIMKATEIMFLRGDLPAGLFVSYYRHEHFRLTSTVRLGNGAARKKP